MTNIFEQATRNKYRYQTNKGILSVEDLWDLPLQSTHKVNLDDIAQDLDREIEATQGKSRVKATTENTGLRTALEVVDYIIKVKLAEAETRKTAKTTQERRQKLIEALAGKEEDTLKGMTMEEIQKELAAL